MTRSATVPDTLRHAYDARLDVAKIARGHGHGIVGVIGNTIPVELILAAGRTPILVTADTTRPTPRADLYMEDVIAPETRALFESAANGDLAFLDLLIVSRPYAQLYYYLKEVYRLGRGPQIPPLHIYDLMQSQRDAVRAYNWTHLQALVERLERLVGEELSERRMRDAIAQTNQVRRIQRRLLDLRWMSAVSGVEAMVMLGAAYFVPPAEYATTLASAVIHMGPDPGLLDRPRLLIVTAEPLAHTRLHTALEEAGGLVVAEDDWWGSRAPGADIPLAASAREAIFQKYWLDTASPGVYPAQAREAWLRQHALRADLDGVVFYLPPSDRQLGWDYPRLNAWLGAAGKPTLLVRADATAEDGFATIRQQAEHFVGSLA